MPTYVYKFIDTDETIEVQQSFDEASLTEYAHPTTGQTMPVKKVFLPVGVTFKGDGFYKTDSRSAAKKSTSETGTSKSETGTSSTESSGGSSGSSSSGSSTTETKTSTGTTSSGSSSSGSSSASSGD